MERYVITKEPSGVTSHVGGLYGARGRVLLSSSEGAFLIMYAKYTRKATL